MTLLRVCLGSSCFARGNRDLVEIAQQFVTNHADVCLELVGSLCAGRCVNGPIVEVDTVVHEQVDGPALRRILASIHTSDSQA